MLSFIATIITFLFGVTAAFAQSSYHIRPGDRLAIEVLEAPSMSREVLVTPDGRITFPFAGSVLAAGSQPDRVAERLTEAIESNFAVRPSVFVSVAALGQAGGVEATTSAATTITVYFMGEVNNPGPQTFQPGTTFLQGLAQSGGLTSFAAERRVQLRRFSPNSGREEVVVIDYRSLQRGPASRQVVTLADGDVVLVPQRRLFE